MKNENLYNKTVNILVDAYFNDTLEHGDQCCCAFGNIVAANCGIKITKENKNHALNALWYDVIHFSGSGKLNPDYKKKIEALEQINTTGYSPKECVIIEKAFEMANEGISEEDHMFNGLMAVIDVLDIIHDNTDVKTTNKVKQLFVKRDSQQLCVVDSGNGVIS